MTAQIANGGFKIKPRIIFDKKDNDLRDYLKHKMKILMSHFLRNLLVKKL